MHIKQIRLLLALGTVSLGALGAQLSNAQSTPVTIQMWHHAGQGGEREAVAAAVRRFNAANRDIKVEIAVLPDGSYNDQVNAAALADTLPCLLDFDGPNNYNYAWAGKLIPLDKYVPADLKADLLPSLLQQATYNGKIYNLGQFDSGLALWGNRDTLTKAGIRIPKGIADAWTKTEFDAALTKLKAAGVAFPLDLKLNYGVGEWFTYGFSPIIQSFGGDLINRRDFKSANGVLNGNASVRAMTWFQGLIKQGFVNPKPAGDTDFVEGRSALSWVGHWMYPDYKKALGNKLVLLPMPKLGARAVTGMGSWTWGISSDCKTPDQAAKFLNFILSTDEVSAMATASGAVPGRKSAIARSKLFADGGELNVYVQQLNGGVARARPATPAYPTITTAFAEAVNNIITGADVKGELDKAVKKIDTNIADNKGYPTK
jgi:multiple sugar transport system substrate-binding protein